MKNLINCFYKSLDIVTGRVTREEYWTFVAFRIIIYVILVTIELILSSMGINSVIFNIMFNLTDFVLSTCLISLGVQKVRATTGKGRNYLRILIPFIGLFQILYYLLKEEQVA